MPTLVEEQIARIRDACQREPIDWDAIRSAALALDVDARTKDQKRAVEELKRAADRHGVQIAIIRVEHEFLDGTPGPDGWPRKF